MSSLGKEGDIETVEGKMIDRLILNFFNSGDRRNSD
jgi:hypothetical protein